MRRINLFTLFMSLAVIAVADAQKISWKDLVKLGDKQTQAEAYSSAAEYYKTAWQLKPKDMGLAYKTGISYLKARDYKNAEQALDYVKDERKEYPMAMYYYAVSLKQNENCLRANKIFEAFAADYKARDKDSIQNLVKLQMDGCDLATTNEASSVQVEHLKSSINSIRTECTPFPVGTSTLYYTSNVDDKLRIYQARKQGDVWSDITPLSLFGKLEKDVASASFSKSGNRMYFSQCETNFKGKKVCALYVTERQGSVWKSPTRLPELINIDGTVNTEPFVWLEGELEYLFFVSDRSGGMGGKDIWYTTHHLKSDDLTFTFPVNLSNSVNTWGDELTPFYDGDSRTLYFSNNTRVSLGGFDVYAANGFKTEWTAPTNIGKSINSAADDYGFVLNFNRTGGYLVSNRLNGIEKVSSTDDDIFQFTGWSAQSVQNTTNIVGRLHDANGNTLYDVQGILYILSATDDSPTIIETKNFAEGHYAFNLLLNKKYRLEFRKDGYASTIISLETPSTMPKSDFQQDIKLVSNAETSASASTSSNTNSGPIGNVLYLNDLTEAQKQVIAYMGSERKPYIKIGEEWIEVLPGSRPVISSTTPPVVTVTTPPVSEKVRNGVNENPHISTELPTPISTTPPPLTVPNTSSEIIATPPTTTTTTTTTSIPTTTIESSTPMQPVTTTSSSMGESFKVQIAAVTKYNQDKFANAGQIGSVSTETSPTNAIRIMVGTYYSRTEAEQAQAQLRALGYSGAYLVRYYNDERVNK